MFSIILGTRDRPATFEVALDSVLAQADADFEVVVVNDGSAEEHLPAYREILKHGGAVLGERLKVNWLPRRPNGHGQSYSLNVGVSLSTRDYVGYLDDDDEWTDRYNLARAAGVIEEARAERMIPDLYMANQHAFTPSGQVEGPVWLEGLEAELRRRGRAAGPDGSFEVNLSELMAIRGFCHLNCFIVRRGLYERIGGMDEGIRWECDRDIYLRLVDEAAYMLHHPAAVSRHNVPDPLKASSITTSLSTVDKHLYQLRVLDKAALFAKDPQIRSHGRLHKSFALKKIAEELARTGSWRTALFYAAQALAARPTLKWTGFTAYCATKSLFSRL
jgi:glycosyltransferase involved in cell wall biosynthesis